MAYSENVFYPDGKFLGTFKYNEEGGYLISKNVNIFTDNELTRRETYSGGTAGVTAALTYAEEFEKGIDGIYKYKETREYSDGTTISKKIRKCSILATGAYCHTKVYENGTDLSYTISCCSNTDGSGNRICKETIIYPS